MGKLIVERGIVFFFVTPKSGLIATVFWMPQLFKIEANASMIRLKVSFFILLMAISAKVIKLLK
jgi:hypothetical protein